MRYIKLYILISVMTYVIGMLTFMKMPFEETVHNQVAFAAILINTFVAVVLAIIKWRKL